MGASLPALLRRPVVLWTAIAGALVAASVTVLLVVPGRGDDNSSFLDDSLPFAERVQDLLDQMTIEEKVGQMTQVALPAIDGDPSDIAELRHRLAPHRRRRRPPRHARGLGRHDRRLPAPRPSTRACGIPLIYGVDAVHGHNNVAGATIFPHNIGLGATRDPDARPSRSAAITAEEVAGTGIDWDFAPCLCVARNDRWGRTYESFGEDPGLAIRVRRPIISGLQGEDLAANTSVLATAKHYVGDGGTAYGTSTTGYTIDQGNTQLTEAELRAIHLPPFRGRRRRRASARSCLVLQHLGTA